MDTYDFGLAWNWQYDTGFVGLIANACQARGVSLLQITPETLAGVVQGLEQQSLSFWAFFDRASDGDPQYMPVVEWARAHARYRINPYEHARRAWDKAAMHRALYGRVPTPPTLILPPYEQQPDLPALDLAQVGEHFCIKPAHGGGGAGVVLNATTLDQIAEARKEYPADSYLVQTRVNVVEMASHPAWFRVYYCVGVTYPCWWHPTSHVSAAVTPDEEQAYSLTPLRTLVAAVAELCHLHLFSTEFALVEGVGFLAIDYVNDPIDLRLQSEAADGVPDALVRELAERLVASVAERRPASPLHPHQIDAVADELGLA